MKYFIIAGEASGDLHASNLVKGIRLHDENADFEAWGGDLMIAGGVKVLKHIRELAFMGFTEVIVNIRTIFRNFDLVKEQILQYAPDALILVDYPGFNMRMAKWARKQNIKVYYYISPNVWAWNTKRVYHFKKYCEKLFVILPFEKDFYSRFGIEVIYEGHPLIDAVEGHRQVRYQEFCNENTLDTKPIIALLAGSRKQEISRMLPIMLQLVDDYPQFQFVVAGAPAIEKKYYDDLMQNSKAKLVLNKTYALLSHAKAGIIVSGTATLETALFDVPQVVGYRSGFVSAAIAGLVMKVKFISLVNLIMNKPVVTELLQYQFNKQKLKYEFEKVLPGTPESVRMKEEYALLRQMLGVSGSSVRVGAQIVKLIKNA